MESSTKSKDPAVAALTVKSKKCGQLVFSAAEVARFGRESIKHAVRYMDQNYRRHINDGHALIINSLIGSWGWDQVEASEKMYPSYEETQENMRKLEDEKKIAIEQRKNPEHQKRANEFFGLLKDKSNER
jgi:hypothetical protein